MADLILNGDDSNSCSLLLCEKVPDDTRRGLKKGDLGLLMAWFVDANGFMRLVWRGSCSMSLATLTLGVGVGRMEVDTRYATQSTVSVRSPHTNQKDVFLSTRYSTLKVIILNK